MSYFTLSTVVLKLIDQTTAENIIIEDAECGDIGRRLLRILFTDLKHIEWRKGHNNMMLITSTKLSKSCV